MAEMWKPLEIDTYKHWVAAILQEASNELTDWESDFVQNMENWLDAGKQLTQRQAQVLERIYAENTK
jgi:hypothetical protein